MWNGTAATLKPKPTSTNPAPSTARGTAPGDKRPTARATRSSEVLPLTPYRSAMP